MFLRKRDEPRPVAISTSAAELSDDKYLDFVNEIFPPRWGETRRQSAAAQEAFLQWVEAISTPSYGERRPLSAKAQKELADSVSSITSDDAGPRRPRNTHRRTRASNGDTPGLNEVWDPAKHPRGGYPQNRGWWSPNAGSASLRGTSSTTRTIGGPIDGAGPRGVHASSADDRGMYPSRGASAAGASAYLTNFQSADSISNSIMRLAAEGDVDGLVSLVDSGGLNAAQEALAKSMIQRLRSTAQQIIAKECKGSIHRKFPREMYNVRLKDIIALAKRGNDAARRARKLLTSNEYKKGQ
jgi:hypothetical protein